MPGRGRRIAHESRAPAAEELARAFTERGEVQADDRAVAVLRVEELEVAEGGQGRGHVDGDEAAEGVGGGPAGPVAALGDRVGDLCGAGHQRLLAGVEGFGRVGEGQVACEGGGWALCFDAGEG